MVNDILKAMVALGRFRVDVALPNEIFRPEKKDMWMKMEVLPIPNAMQSFSTIEQSGILQLSLFVPIGTGSESIIDKGREIVNFFGNQKSYQIYGHQIIISKSTALTLLTGDKEKWAMLPISIEYTITKERG